MSLLSFIIGGKLAMRGVAGSSDGGGCAKHTMPDGTPRFDKRGGPLWHLDSSERRAAANASGPATSLRRASTTGNQTANTKRRQQDTAPHKAQSMTLSSLSPPLAAEADKPRTVGSLSSLSALTPTGEENEDQEGEHKMEGSFEEDDTVFSACGAL